MRHSLRVVVALVAGLALLAWGASVLVTRTTRAWFERDMVLRAQLAVSGGREALVAHWSPGHEAELGKVLVGMTRDERVLGAAACGADLQLRAKTIDYPPSLLCPSLAWGGLGQSVSSERSCYFLVQYTLATASPLFS